MTFEHSEVALFPADFATAQEDPFRKLVAKK
jgi:hypothetical protein